MLAVDEAGFWGSEAGSICALRGDVWQLLSSGVSASAVRWTTPVTAVSEPGGETEVSFGNAAAESYD